MINQTDVGDDDGTIRATLRFRWSLVIGIGVQTIALVAWLVQMHADIAYLKARNDEQDRLISRIDDNGTRKLALIDERQQLMLKQTIENGLIAQKALDAIIQHMNSMPKP